MTGATFSSTHYQEYQETGNKNLFEEVIEKMILEGVAGMNESTMSAIKNIPNDKKRMAILRLLMESSSSHIQMFQKIKGLVNKDISRLEHIKDIIMLLRDYVKVGDVEKERFGEVMTPLELVKEMLNIIPDGVWSNPNLKWLDPANGTGPYPMVVIYKLMKGLTEWEPNEERRYRHIVENMIYACELQPKNTFLYLCAIDPFDQYNVNVYTGSFLDGGFDYHMKNVWGVDKFDLLIGNPPYQDGEKKEEANKLYPKFIYKSVLLSNTDAVVCMVTPTGWFNNTADIGKGKSGISILKEFKNLNLSVLNPNSKELQKKYFSGVGSTFCYFSLLNNNKYRGTKLIGGLKPTVVDIRKYDFLPKISNILAFQIIQKVLSKKGDQFNWVDQNHNLLKEEVRIKSDRECFKNFHTPAKGGTFVYSSNEHPNKTDKKVIISISGKYVPIRDCGNLGFSNMCLAIICKDEDEMGLAYSQMNSKLYKFVIECGKFSGFNPRKLILQLINTNISDEKLLYKYYDISSEEIEFIESVII